MAAAHRTQGNESLDPVDHGGPAADGRGAPARAGGTMRAPGVSVSSLGEELQTPVCELVTRSPLVVERGTTVTDVARAMRAKRTSAALVGPDAVGIVTDRDLRNRVLADDRPAATPIEDVMTRPVLALAADTPVHEVLLLMLDRDVNHVAVLRGGQVVGLVTDKDLLRAQARGPLLLLERIKAAEHAGGLDGYALEIAGTARALAAAEIEPVRIARIIASLNDTLAHRLLDLAEEELGPPPCAYAWLALGSEGRMEQVLMTDQDNALAFADDTAEARAYFETLADRVVGGLLEAGFPPCPGGYMATRWRRPLADWTALFDGWMDRPDAQALLEAQVFLDYRVVHGGLSLEPVDAVVRSGAGRPRFLHHMARAALRFRPPLGVFGRIRADGGRLDLKHAGLAAIVLIGRLGGIAAGSRAQSTPERLAAAVGAGIVSSGGAEALTEAFRLLMRLRLREQLRALDAGSAPDNTVALGSLTPLEQRRLRDALRTVAETQKAIGIRFGAGSAP